MKYFILIVVIAFANSCDKSQSGDTKKNIPKNIVKEVKNIPSKLESVDTIRYLCQYKDIGLQVIKDGKLNLGDIDKICYDENKQLFFILDTRTNPGVYLFNASGEYLYKIGMQGRGPGEYIKPLDIILIKEAERVVVVDRKSLQILVYSYNGDSLYQFSTKIDKNKIIYPDAIQYADGKFYVVSLYNTLGSNLAVSIFDLKGKYLKSTYFLDKRTVKGPRLSQYPKIFNLYDKKLYIPSMYNLQMGELSLTDNTITMLSVENQYINSVGKTALMMMDKIISRRPPYNYSEILNLLVDNIEHFYFININQHYRFIKTSRRILLYDGDWNLLFVKNQEDFKIAPRQYRYPAGSKYLYLFGKIAGSWSQGIICAGYDPSISDQYNDSLPTIRLFRFQGTNK